MTEKDFRTIISQLDISKVQKEQNDLLLNQYIASLTKLLDNVDIQSIQRTNSYALGYTFPGEQVLDYVLAFVPRVEVKSYKQLVFNDFENALIKNNCLDYNRQDAQGNFICSIAPISFRLFVRFVDTAEDDIASHNAKIEFFAKANSEYSLFCNAVKLIKYFAKDQDVTLLSDEIIATLLYYGLKNYYIGSRYNEYLNSFIKAMDDFLNYRIISLIDNAGSLSKKIYVINDFSNPEHNLTSHINEVNVSECRRLRKHLARTIDLTGEKSFNANDPINLLIDPVLDEHTKTYMWSFKIKELQVSNSGGSYDKSIDQQLSAALKGLFKGLKYVVDNNLNKKVNVKCALDYLLDEKLTVSGENSSRRKTINAFIQDNNLKVNITN